MVKKEASILNNYHPCDALMTTGPVAVGVAMVLTQPILLVAIRDAYFCFMNVHCSKKTTIPQDEE